MTDQTSVFFQPVSLLQKNVILNHKAFDYLLKIICQKYLHHQFLSYHFLTFYLLPLLLHFWQVNAITIAFYVYLFLHDQSGIHHHPALR